MPGSNGNASACCWSQHFCFFSSKSSSTLAHPWAGAVLGSRVQEEKLDFLKNTGRCSATCTASWAQGVMRSEEQSWSLWQEVPLGDYQHHQQSLWFPGNNCFSFWKLFHHCQPTRFCTHLCYLKYKFSKTVLVMAQASPLSCGRSWLSSLSSWESWSPWPFWLPFSNPLYPSSDTEPHTWPLMWVHQAGAAKWCPLSSSQ